MKYSIDATRAGDAVNRFMRQHIEALQRDVNGTVLDFSLNKRVDDLCLRIARDPKISLAGEPKQLRALLAARLMVFLASTLEADGETEVMSFPAAPSEADLIAALFRRMIVKTKLPKAWNGQRWEPPPTRRQ